MLGISDGMSDFVKVAEAKDIPPLKMKEVDFNGAKVCVVNVEGKYYAIGNVCTHTGGPLAEGKLEGYVVECPWHGSKFDIRSGEVIQSPAIRPEPSYEVKTEGENILINNSS